MFTVASSSLPQQDVQTFSNASGSGKAGGTMTGPFQTSTATFINFSVSIFFWSSNSTATRPLPAACSSTSFTTFPFFPLYWRADADVRHTTVTEDPSGGSGITKNVCIPRSCSRASLLPCGSSAAVCIHLTDLPICSALFAASKPIAIWSEERFA